MDIDRAEQIINSPETIKVLYQGRPVWINAVHADRNAEIQFMDNRERIQVSVNMLAES